MKKYLFLFLLIFMFSCSFSTMVIRQMTPILENSAQALYEESDLQIAEQALASNLKLLEGFLKNDPENRELLILLAQGYAGYALGFSEDEEPLRAKKFYLRARDYALKVLSLDTKFIQAKEKGLDALQAYLDHLEIEDVPALFWTGFAWSGYVNLALNEPDALLALPEIQLYMQRVEVLQPEYFYGAVYLFWGGVYGMKPAILGGDPHKAGDYFRKNIELNKGDFLLAYVYAAQFYAAKILDEALFEQYLKTVETTPADVRRELTLFNQIAKQKAKRLLAQKTDLF